MTGEPAGAQDELLRSPIGVALALALAGAICLVPLIPSVEAVLRVGPRDVAVAMGAFAMVLIVGAIVYHRASAGSRVYRIWDRVETVLVQVSVLSLVLASGRGDSFFWVLWIAHLSLLGRYARDVRFCVGSFIALVGLVALGFLIADHLDAAALSIVIGGVGIYIYWVALAASRRLEAADADRALLAAELADLRVRQERERIARDIHDGLGADLAAIDWRLRGLRGTGGSATLHEDVDELVARLGHGAGELRAIVWALRTPSRSWPELVAYLRQRIAELCGDAIRAEVDVGAGDVPTIPGELALDYLRAVLELVHNTARHAGARILRVSLRASASALTASVEDDGRGLPIDALARDEGGLANLRVRATRAGGTLTSSVRAGGGAHLAISFPLGGA